MVFVKFVKRWRYYESGMVQEIEPVVAKGLVAGGFAEYHEPPSIEKTKPIQEVYNPVAEVEKVTPVSKKRGRPAKKKE